MIYNLDVLMECYWDSRYVERIGKDQVYFDVLCSVFLTGPVEEHFVRILLLLQVRNCLYV